MARDVTRRPFVKYVSGLLAGRLGFGACRRKSSSGMATSNPSFWIMETWFVKICSIWRGIRRRSTIFRPIERTRFRDCDDGYRNGRNKYEA